MKRLFFPRWVRDAADTTGGGLHGHLGLPPGLSCKDAPSPQPGSIRGGTAGQGPLGPVTATGRCQELTTNEQKASASTKTFSFS